MNINHVVITGNLTRDPELRYADGGTAICEVGVGVNTRRKDGGTGEWADKANFFNVVVFGKRAEAVVQNLSKGSRVAVDGRLDWQQWEAKDGSGKRETVKIIANHVEFLGRKAEGAPSPSADEGQVEAGAASEAEEIPF